MNSQRKIQPLAKPNALRTFHWHEDSINIEDK
jgi:hypothetical protein